ncbi:hypothetical protein T492DRAFT_864140 [Pavlovales sp. CCMP2436]|nr:hypothetical protein T492DRAFT_864140 [Pavlovales sp. CCMP2436]
MLNSQPMSLGYSSPEPGVRAGRAMMVSRKAAGRASIIIDELAGGGNNMALPNGGGYGDATSGDATSSAYSGAYGGYGDAYGGASAYGGAYIGGYSGVPQELSLGAASLPDRAHFARSLATPPGMTQPPQWQRPLLSLVSQHRRPPPLHSQVGFFPPAQLPPQANGRWSPAPTVGVLPPRPGDLAVPPVSCAGAGGRARAAATLRCATTFAAAQGGSAPSSGRYSQGASPTKGPPPPSLFDELPPPTHTGLAMPSSALRPPARNAEPVRRSSMGGGQAASPTGRQRAVVLQSVIKFDRGSPGGSGSPLAGQPGPPSQQPFAGGGSGV